jgi:PIN domain nuclease of toxin-antitoxin system
MLMLDTHIAVAFAEGKTAGLSRRALRCVDREPTLLSPAVVLELEMLHEIGRLKLTANAIVAILQNDLQIGVALERFADVARESLRFGFTRDPFDRLITAHASWNRAQLLTFDRNLLKHFELAMS